VFLQHTSLVVDMCMGEVAARYVLQSQDELPLAGPPVVVPPSGRRSKRARNGGRSGPADAQALVAEITRRRILH
jgi:hypothetical protein